MSWHPTKRLESEANAEGDWRSIDPPPRVTRLTPAPRPRGGEPRKARSAAPRPRLERVLVRAEDHLLLVHLDEVDWIEGDGNYVVLHAGGAAHRHRATLAALGARLDPSRFARIHRSTLVNVDRVRELRPGGSGTYDVVLRDGATLTLSRGYRRRFLALLDGEE